MPGSDFLREKLQVKLFGFAFEVGWRVAHVIGKRYAVSKDRMVKHEKELVLHLL